MHHLIPTNSPSSHPPQRQASGLSLDVVLPIAPDFRIEFGQPAQAIADGMIPVDGADLGWPGMLPNPC
jgi:hypothetical protein